jgi:hypothetical protein
MPGSSMVLIAIGVTGMGMQVTVVIIVSSLLCPHRESPQHSQQEGKSFFHEKIKNSTCKNILKKAEKIVTSGQLFEITTSCRPLCLLLKSKLPAAPYFPNFAA